MTWNFMLVIRKLMTLLYYNLITHIRCFHFTPRNEKFWVALASSDSSTPTLPSEGGYPLPAPSERLSWKCLQSSRNYRPSSLLPSLWGWPVLWRPPSLSPVLSLGTSEVRLLGEYDEQNGSWNSTRGTYSVRAYGTLCTVSVMSGRSGRIFWSGGGSWNGSVGPLGGGTGISSGRRCRRGDCGSNYHSDGAKDHFDSSILTN